LSSRDRRCKSETGKEYCWKKFAALPSCQDTALAELPANRLGRSDVHSWGRRAVASIRLGTLLEVKLLPTCRREGSIHPAPPLPCLKSAPQAANI